MHRIEQGCGKSCSRLIISLELGIWLGTGHRCDSHSTERKKERVRLGLIEGAGWVLSPEGTSQPP